MGLHAIHDDGSIHWRCHHKACKPLQAHVSHDDIYFVNHDLVALPPCSCGSRMFVRVAFTPEELAATNAIQYGMVPEEMTLPHALTGEPIPVMIPALRPIGANPFFARHQEFAKHLEAHGKRYIAPKSSADEKEKEMDDDSTAES
ncbi:hypothetical protein [Tengunoibacter tsumagoiensis]|uniref:Uncharacterized protein n=1 Tax=Tengunoibacter tsumagoiensis TaxID=2014871 RepID=A0A402A5G4_9CHLR|nr:hypothetical protein [Tengunoibacter tsumagoiensis]GCE14207.1 hypothetical protein KTT_40660 [Tengunoibacter tsumagoiensis]GCE14261.1 hypothetical protein KTT_41200 [Tengunoibacter tsumagoiensis]